MRMTVDCSGKEFAPFTLPPLGNGELSLQIDPEGAMSPRFGSGSDCNISNWNGMTPGIRRAGWRWGGSHTAGRELFPFGFFTQELPGREEPESRRLTFDTELAEVASELRWPDGCVLTSEIFCHASLNLVAIRKRSSHPMQYRFSHHPEHRRLRLEPIETGLWNCVYDLDELREERLAIVAPLPGFTPERGGLAWQGELTEGVWILAWGEEAIRAARGRTFDELRREHRGEWAAFYRRSRPAALPEHLKRSYETALYHLKISTTLWSVPTGLFDSHWHGRFFAFDELFILRGLLSAGCYAEARRIPAFRIATHDYARQRACKGSTGDGSCHYSWETLEDGSEGAPTGFWLDHVFHNAHVALGIAEYAKCSGDAGILEAGGREVIRSSALFFEKHMLYECGGRTIIGSCTDLERLGEHRRNAFMTTCSAIALFRTAADTALTPAEALHYQKLAAKLAAGLPEENGRFVAYPGCPDASIGLLSGFYPYGVLPSRDGRALAALEGFIASERLVGNMYSTGGSVCAWYRLWKCMALLYAGRREEAAAELERLAGETGRWGELFEIYERSMRPFFTTAEGVFISAVHQLYGEQVPSPYSKQPLQEETTGRCRS